MGPLHFQAVLIEVAYLRPQGPAEINRPGETNTALDRMGKQGLECVLMLLLHALNRTLIIQAIQIFDLEFALQQMATGIAAALNAGAAAAQTTISSWRL